MRGENSDVNELGDKERGKGGDEKRKKGEIKRFGLLVLLLCVCVNVVQQGHRL